MTYKEIMAISIENVEESVSVDGGSITISFELNGIHCWLSAYFSEENSYSPGMITYGRPRFYPFCHQQEINCLILRKHRKTIFERVIQSKSIRLNWLYREYKLD